MSGPGAHGFPERRPSAPGTFLEKVLGGMSAFTMLMTLPQVSAVWVGGDARGVSLASWTAYLVAACLWLVHGIRRRDKAIWAACVGWIVLDAAIVVGVLVHR